MIFGMIGLSTILTIGDIVVGIIHGDTTGIDLIIGDIVGSMDLFIIHHIMLFGIAVEKMLI
tara:strand:+ start:5018 stop:5200 length:183 start_codon:yes stop_codon:yes gene_type:complete